MAKDPAILFYTSDFLTGTMTMTDEQVGKYIRLLCLQHQKNYLSEKDMLHICKSYDEDIFSKFVKDESGYYNQRLKDESEKRKAYAESRANNRKKTYEKHMKNISNSYEQHMENENEIENEDVNTDDIDIKSANKKFVPPDKLDVINHMAEKLPDEEAVKQGELFYSYYESNGWRVGKNKMKKWKAAATGWIERSKEFKTTKNGTTKTEQLAADVQEAFNRRFGNL